MNFAKFKIKKNHLRFNKECHYKSKLIKAIAVKAWDASVNALSFGVFSEERQGKDFCFDLGIILISSVSFGLLPISVAFQVGKPLITVDKKSGVLNH
jgi:hypothetical protein